MHVTDLLYAFGGLALWYTILLGLAWWAEKPRLCKCRNCRSTRLHRYQDGGHDYVETCLDCGATYGVMDDPFNIVERLR